MLPIDNSDGEDLLRSRLRGDLKRAQLRAEQTYGAV